MMNPESFRIELHAALATLRAVAGDAGVHRGDFDEALAGIEAELVGDVSALRPRQVLLWALERGTRFERLRELEAPEIILRREMLILRQLPHWLETVGPSFRWRHHPGDFEARRFFDPEPERVAEHEGWKIGYAAFGDTALDDVASGHVDLSDPFLRMLEGHPDLWREQLEVLKSTASGGAFASHAFCSLVGEHAVVPNVEVTPAALRELKRGIEMHEIDTPWVGCRESPFVLSRLTALLGPPPDLEQPGFDLVVRRGDTSFRVSACDDHGDGMPALTVQPTSALDHARAIVGLLFSRRPELADIELLGHCNTTGVAYTLGARRSRLFLEAVDGEIVVPPWRHDHR